MADFNPSEALAQLGTTAGVQLDPEAVQAIRDAINEVVNAAKAVVEYMVEGFKMVVDSFVDTWEIYCRARVPPQWWHMYKHAKKGRVRHKYYNRIMRTVYGKQKNRRR